MGMQIPPSVFVADLLVERFEIRREVGPIFAVADSELIEFAPGRTHAGSDSYYDFGGFCQER